MAAAGRGTFTSETARNSVCLEAVIGNDFLVEGNKVWYNLNGIKKGYVNYWGIKSVLDKTLFLTR